METLYFRICVFLGLLAGAVIVALPLRRPFADFHEFVRRTPKWQRAFLALLAAVFIAYGSTKTNQMDNAGLGLRSRSAMDDNILCAPTPLIYTLASPTVTPADIARGWQLWEVRTNHNLSYAMPEGATLATNWWLRGAYEDVKPFDFDSWRFPFGSNSYSSAWAFSWGKVRFALADTNAEIAAVGAPMSAVPYRSRLWSAADTNDSRFITWENFALNRDTNTPVNAQVELRTTGDFVTRSNEVETIYRRVDDFDWDGDGIPNWSDWDPYWYDGDYTGQDEWWAEYVNETVGNYWGTDAICNPSDGGIYQVQALAGLDWGAEDERYYRWEEDESSDYGIKRAGDFKAFGVCDEEWQKTVRNSAKGYLGSQMFALMTSLDGEYGFSSIAEKRDKCNYFVAYVIKGAGLFLGIQHISTITASLYPPTANDWANGAAIPGWQHMDSNCLLQPGFVIGHPASAHGHCGFVDFDGAGISAGSRCVRRTVNPWLDGTSGFNKREMEEP